ncbi:hypothetical protein KEJ26_00340 [Candidatus Bathyarchaeota archaeon]|nr:hypothetical protein [Candidatus Bathyarchaeota archaeon]
MSSPHRLVIEFFRLVVSRNFTEAERKLEELKQVTRRTSNPDWSRGYISALDGMLIGLKGDDDRYVFIKRINFDEKVVSSLKKEFAANSASQTHDDFDRGFFTAWTDYMRVLEKTKPWLTLQAPSNASESNRKSVVKTAEETM